MTKKRTPTVSLPLVVNPNAKQRAALKKAYANIRKEFARPEKRALIRELAGCFARAAVKRVIQEEKKKAKAGSRSPPIYFIPASAIEVRSKRRAKK